MNYFLVGLLSLFFLSCNDTKMQQKPPTVDAKKDNADIVGATGSTKSISITGSNSIRLNQCAGEYTVTLSTIDVDSVIVLLTSDLSLSFYTDNTCQTKVEQVSIAKPASGEAKSVFYVKTTTDTVKTGKITGTSTNYTPATLDLSLSSENDPLIIAEIGDKSVNTGENSGNSTSDRRLLSETLDFQVNSSGGVGSIKYTLVSNPALSNLTINNGRIIFKPGLMTASGYVSQSGMYQIAITASDDSGQSDSATFNLFIKPIIFTNFTIPNTANNAPLIFKIQMKESLHPNRSYQLATQKANMALFSKTCVNIKDKSKSITLQGDITIKKVDIRKEGSFFLHDFEISIPPANSVYHDNNVFLFPLELFPDPATSISSNNPASSIFINTYNSRCKNLLNESQGSECEKKAINEDGGSNYYYCSDYLPAGLDISKYYCEHAALSGVSVSECK